MKKQKLQIERIEELDRKQLTTLQEFGYSIAIGVIVLFFFLFWIGIIVGTEKLLAWIALN